MTDENRNEELGPEEGDEGGGGDEAAFWARFDEGVAKHITDERIDAALGRIIASGEAQLAEEEKKGEAEDDQEDEDGGQRSRERSDAERSRDAGRRGRRAPSSYWERARRILY